MANPSYTLTVNVDQEMNDWIEAQSLSRSALGKEALRRMKEGTEQTPDFSVDPYGTAMGMIRRALEEAERNRGAMSHGEYGILGVATRALLEEDPAWSTPLLEQLSQAPTE